MQTYGLIGFPLGHSFSAKYFAEKFAAERIEGCEYLNFEIENIERIKDIISQTATLKGFNITIPYKQAIMPYLNSISYEAAEIGAVNCVRVTDKGLHGYNTDAYGFTSSLLKLIGDERPSALVLGSGGASKAACYALKSLKIKYSVVSRGVVEGGLTYEQLTSEVIATHRLIINCTPLGTFPKVEGAPEIPYKLLTNSHFLFDMVYNPPLTQFLSRGAEYGAQICNGQGMLQAQAEKSWEIWTSL